MTSRIDQESHRNGYRAWRRSARRSRGNQLVEFGPTVWIIFILLLFPLIALGTLGLRYAFLAYAARLAASAGAESSTFLSDSNPPSNLSAVNNATKAANLAVSKFSGITLTSVTCYIVVTPLAGGPAVSQTSPLKQAADVNNNAYNFAVALQAQLAPIVPGTEQWSVPIPGVNSPLSTSARAECFFESTQGLTQ